MIYHRFIRGLLLTENDGAGFAFFSIVPAILLFAGIAASLLGGITKLEYAFLAAAGLSGVASVAVSRRIQSHATDLGNLGIPFRELLTQSRNMFSQNVLTAAQPVLIYYIVRSFGGTTVDIGFVNISTLSMVAGNALFAMAAPIFYNRWSKSLAAHQLFGLEARVFLLSALVVLLCVLVIPLVPFLVPTILGTRYSPAIFAMQLTTLALPALFYSRVITPALYGIGQAKLVATMSLLRLVVSIGVLCALIASGWGLVVSAASAWLIGEWAASAGTAIEISRRKHRTEFT
ncbi:hypothetical protein PSQ19_11055 [Devosia algicola]|uniref:Polysaccharide biosynthesis protein C-terminal domain-containing protein n=1 Tax=Devosia algicola TaxID=3026418 RepID=A0ABY7YJA5_9HYPH|nr:hypothetical protein [Devosia algicola]WDR01364.1 hypothetical protein PSQ19_11055 [Devosia algicola]